MPIRTEPGAGAVGNLPILAIMWKLARVTSACVGAGYPTIGQIELHHIVDILEDNLVAIKEHDALLTANAQHAISIPVEILHGLMRWCTSLAHFPMYLTRGIGT